MFEHLEQYIKENRSQAEDDMWAGEIAFYGSDSTAGRAIADAWTER